MPPHSQKLAIALAILAASTMATWPPTAVVVAHYDPQDYVDAHNRARADVHVGPVEWDDDVARYAQHYAEKRRHDCKLWHSAGGSYGENLFWGGWGTAWTAVNAVAAWVEEGRYYHYESNECDDGHKCYLYTQVVWRSSTRIGCARVECDHHGGVFIICNYHPAGNVPGEKPY